ncbi:hypothetical protein KR200_009266 [Drosophila serrata]|nr:hypothetical protein KR200_009266 [Drosophila serrata]
MRSWFLTLSLLLLAASATFHTAEARGGRGRGGGSFGGLFGGWRKYKKPSSSGGGRRVVSGSPVHTAMTVPKPPPPPPQPPKPMMVPKQQVPSYPRQQMPPGYGYGSYPMGQSSGTVYASPQALPPGAVFLSQPPVGMNRGLGGSGDFLTGMLAGHMMNNLLFGHRHHGSHIIRNRGEEEQVAQGNGRQIIIVNNGQQLPEEVAQNETTISGEASVVVPPENPLNEEDGAGEDEETVEGHGDGDEESAPVSSEESPDPEATLPPMLDGGIVCFPIMMNETDPENPEVTRQVERVACFPVPPHNSVSPPPWNHPTTEPPIVAGDIVGGSEAGGSVGAPEGQHDEGAGDAVEVASFVAGRAANVKTDSS